MRYTSVTDLTPLAETRLAWLDCAATPVADPSPLANLPLTSLNVNGTNVKNLRPLQPLRLTMLHCDQTRVADLTPLEGMPLAVLHCAGTGVSDLSPLKNMKLYGLSIQNTPVSDLTPLKGMPLSFLDCGRTRVRDLTPLLGMPLKTLMCDFDPARDGPVLRACPSSRSSTTRKRRASGASTQASRALPPIEWRWHGRARLLPSREPRVTGGMQLGIALTKLPEANVVSGRTALFMDPVTLQQRLQEISTIWPLLRQAHQGESADRTLAQAELLHRYQRTVYCYLLQAVEQVPDRADDLFQEFALRFIRGDFHHADRQRGRFRDYLKTSLDHLIVNYLKRQGRDRQPAAIPGQRARHPGRGSGPALLAPVVPGAARPCLGVAGGGAERGRPTLLRGTAAAFRASRTDGGRPGGAVHGSTSTIPAIHGGGHPQDLAACPRAVRRVPDRGSEAHAADAVAPTWSRS